MSTKNKCLLFTRVSTELQSLESQIDKLKEEAKRFGYTESSITIIKGKESAVKLDIEERETIQELIEYVETGKYDMVFIWEVSRLARRPKVLYEVREFLIKHNVNLHCMNPCFTMLKSDGSIDPTASIVFSLFGTMAEEEARLSKERMIRGRRAKRDGGRYIGGHILFGYTYDENDNIYIDEDEAMTVKEIFTRYSRRESIRSIARDLFDRGKLRYDSYDTSLVVMRQMIKRSEYAGIKNGSYPYPAIIDEELYNKVREIADGKNKYKIRVKGCYWCQGILFDTETNRLLSPAKCTNTYRIWNEQTNKGYQINLNIMDSIAWMIAKESYNRKPIMSIDEELSFAKTKLLNLHEKIINNRDKIKEIQKMNDRINDRIIKGKINETKGDNMINENIAEIKNISFRIRSWESECVMYEKIIRERLRKKQTVLNIEEFNDWEKKDLVQQHIRRIDIEKVSATNRKLTIYCYDGVIVNFLIAKRGDYFDIYRDGKELEEFDFKIRFRRKGSKYTAGWKKRV